MNYTYNKNLFENDQLNENDQLDMVKEYGGTIRFINNPSENVQLEAVKNNGCTIRCIKNPSPKIQLEAVKRFPGILDDLFKWIDNPCQEILDLAMIKDIIE